MEVGGTVGEIVQHDVFDVDAAVHGREQRVPERGLGIAGKGLLVSVEVQRVHLPRPTPKQPHREWARREGGNGQGRKAGMGKAGKREWARREGGNGQGGKVCGREGTDQRSADDRRRAARAPAGPVRGARRNVSAGGGHRSDFLIFLIGGRSSTCGACTCRAKARGQCTHPTRPHLADAALVRPPEDVNWSHHQSTSGNQPTMLAVHVLLGPAAAAFPGALFARGSEPGALGSMVCSGFWCERRERNRTRPMNLGTSFF